MSALPAYPTCHQCNKSPAGITSCPDRATGNCPFVLINKSGNRSILLIVCVAFVVVPFFFNIHSIAALVFWLIAAVLGIIALTREILLDNSLTQTKLSRVTLLGVELYHKYEMSGAPMLLPIHLKPILFLPYPASIAVLAPPHAQTFEQITGGPNEVATAVPVRQDFLEASWRTGNLVRAALLSLLANEQIQIYAVPHYIHTRWRSSSSVRVAYIAIPTPRSELSSEVGELERRIIRELADWSSHAQPSEARIGPPLFRLVCGLYPGQVRGASSWLGKIVLEDAKSRNLCRTESKSWFGTTLYWEPSHLRRLEQAHQTLAALSAELDRTHPDFSAALNLQIEKAIRAMEEPFDDD